METSSPRTPPQQQRREGVGSTIVERKLSCGGGGGSELGSPRGPRAVAGFLAWADFANPNKWCRRFFVLHDGWLYRFPNANIKARPEVALSVNGGIIDTPDTHPIVAASQMNLFRITTRNKEVFYFLAETEAEMVMWVKPLIAASMADYAPAASPRDSVAFERGQATYQAASTAPAAAQASASASVSASPRTSPLKLSSGSAAKSPGPTASTAAPTIHAPAQKNRLPHLSLRPSAQSISSPSPASSSSLLSPRALGAATVQLSASCSRLPAGSDAPPGQGGEQLVSPRTAWKKAMSASAISLPQRAEAKLKALQVRATARDVVRLQAIVRGRIARKRYAVIKEMARKRRNVAEEIAQTEKNYVSLLLTTIEVIFEPLQKLNARLDTAQSDQPRLKFGPFLTTPHLCGCGGDGDGDDDRQQLTSLHTNSQLLYKMHARFSDALNAAVTPYAHHRQIGAIFNEFLLFPGSLSSEYQRYVVNYETAVKNYHESLACHTYKSFFDVAITHYRCNALDFCSLLIGPVQRITRYVLLLKELSKYTWTEHPDHDTLKLAMANIAQIAEEVNEAKRKAEGIQRTLSIQTKLDDRKIGRGLAARRYIREGILSQIVKGQQPRERYVFLFSDQLLSSLKKTVRMGLNNTTVRFSSKGAISLLNMVVVRSKKDVTVFKLRSTLPSRSAQTTTKWQANSQRECDSWVQDISHLLAELKHL